MMKQKQRALVIGHFSTVGDLEVLREVERQLLNASLPWDVAPFSKGIARHVAEWLDIRAVKPHDYTHLFVVCGPFRRAYFIRCGVDLDAFSHCTRIGVNLTMIEDINVYNPFDVLIGRDNNIWTRPDASFRHEVSKVPVAGLCLVAVQNEYGERQKHDKARDLLLRLGERSGLALIELDTEWPVHRNAHLLASPEQFESVCARVDVMLSTRLHGTVLSLKNATPVIAIDAILGGGKVLQQTKAIGWPEAFAVDQVTDAVLDEALARCLTPAYRDRARSCAAAARDALANFPADFSASLQAVPQGKPSLTSQPSRRARIQAKLHKMRGKLVRRFQR